MIQTIGSTRTNSNEVTVIRRRKYSDRWVYEIGVAVHACIRTKPGAHMDRKQTIQRNNMELALKNYIGAIQCISLVYVGDNVTN